MQYPKRSAFAWNDDLKVRPVGPSRPETRLYIECPGSNGSGLIEFEPALIVPDAWALRYGAEKLLRRVGYPAGTGRRLVGNILRQVGCGDCDPCLAGLWGQQLAVGLDPVPHMVPAREPSGTLLVTDDRVEFQAGKMMTDPLAFADDLALLLTVEVDAADVGLLAGEITLTALRALESVR